MRVVSDLSEACEGSEPDVWGKGEPGDLLVELKSYWEQNCIFEGHYCTGQVKPDQFIFSQPSPSATGREMQRT